jgi:hypothetical protein
MKAPHKFLGAALMALAMLAATPAMAITAIPTTGLTTVAMNQSFRDLLGSLDVIPRSVGPSVLNGVDGTIQFPVTNAAIDYGTLKAELDHSGGLALQTEAWEVIFSGLSIDTTGTSPIVTGLAISGGNLAGRVPLFDLNLNNMVLVNANKSLSILNVGMSLTQIAADFLNNWFSTSAFTKGMPVGIVTITVLGLDVR